MTKSHKREMLSLLGTMLKMADLLPKLANPAEQVQDLSAACQCLRDNLEQENAPECLNLLHNIEAYIDAANYPSLQLHIKQLESAFKSEIKTKKEILFLPYKASMWDSMESIYLAAKDDPGCDALVMPIPYYDKKDGKCADMRWEIDYPKNIPLIDYRKYSIEECRPDIVFIHNPYDDLNIVTSVHPDYFSQKLRNLTKCLVYVPYFVGNGKNIQGHFCALPACIFAHKVIVQTEDERKIYVSEYKKFAQRNRVPESFERIGGKFLALGSPKLDKAVNAKKEDYEIPAEWEKFVGANPCGRPSSNGCPDTPPKKIVFYNTSIGTLLEHSVEDGKPSNKYLRKVKSVFENFKKQQEAVLLWRPHPLLESAIKSMRPWFEQEYKEIVMEYKNDGCGIYDDSQDLNRAVALSDIYYGDPSSVARLFEAAGKPVVGQTFEPAQAPAALGIYDDGAYVWFMDCYNMLYKHNKQSKETEYVGMIAGQDYWAYRGIAECNKKLYFAPFLADKISVFDIDKKSFEQIDFKSECETDIKRKFKSLVRFRNFIYFIPHEFTVIMRLNTDTNEIEYFSEWVDEISKLQASKLQEAWEHIIFWGGCIVGSEIALVINGVNAVMFFNMETGGYEIRSIGEKSEQYNSICFDGQNYYASSMYKNHIVKWNRKSNEYLKIKLPNTFFRKGKENKFGNFLIQYLNGYVWLFPVIANNAYKIDASTNGIAELPELAEHFGEKDLRWFYGTFIYANENLIYTSTINKGIVEYCTDTRELNLIKFDFEIEPWLLRCLRDYDNLKSKLDETKTEHGNAGKRIWEALKCSI